MRHATSRWGGGRRAYGRHREPGAREWRILSDWSVEPEVHPIYQIPLQRDPSDLLWRPSLKSQLQHRLRRNR